MGPHTPTFLLVGAAKSGTTSMYHYLNEHPQVYMCPVKEPDYFGGYWWDLPLRNIHGLNPDLEIYQDWVKYRDLYKNSSVETCLGEASPSTLFYYQKAIPEIKARLGDPQIIILLRNPVDRAFSHYNFLKRDGKESLSFASALKSEEARIEQNFHYGYFYKSVGYYNKQVASFLENFSQVHIAFFEELKSDPVSEFSKICRFLDIDDSIEPALGTVHNKSGRPRSQWLNTFFRKKNPVRDLIRPAVELFLTEKQRVAIVENIHGINLKENEGMLSEDRLYLEDQYRGDVLALSELINRDLSHWVS